MKVVVFGLGYVGTVSAVGLAARGHTVVGVDVDQAKVFAIEQGRSPVVEPGVEDLLRQATSAGLLSATTQVASALDGADLSLICVGTPSGLHGQTDLAFVARALADLREAMATARPPASGHHSVVLRSTVPPGTGDTVVAPMFGHDMVPPQWTVGTAMCPEFLREGCGVADFFAPPFVVVGTADARTAAAVRELFDFWDGEVTQVAVSTAEALKYTCNAFHATKVSFANEIGRVLRACGVDARDVMTLFCEDHKLNISPAYLRPGFAFGGSCLPKDLRALQHLARTYSLDVPLLAGTMQTNELVVRDVIERVIASGGRCVSLLGLSFKSGTDDLRESPSVDLAERLLGKGFEVRIYDPILNPFGLVGENLRQVHARLPHLERLLFRTPVDALAGADVVLVSTSAREVVDALRGLAGATTPPPRLVLDLNGRLGDEIESLSAYEGASW
jgi:GDP-mannose 6-dehydrogenase